MSPRHPSDLALEQHRVTPSDEITGHLLGCADCQRRQQEADAQESEFRARVFPRTVDAVASGGGRRSFFQLPRLQLGIGMAAAVALAVLLVRREPPEDYLGIKGALALTVYRLGPPQVLLTEGATVPAGAVLAFRIQSAAPCALTLLSLDPELSVLVPSPDQAPPRIVGEVRLDTGAQLDGTPGPERFVALCASSAEDLPQAIQRVQDALNTSSVRSLKALPSLPPGVDHATLLLEKTP
ncbi:MAG: hypothetical protein M3Y59_11765 [Myxococcota bacterium]|nr:hypothetical protein [Myxococcota bacterium]